MNTTRRAVLAAPVALAACNRAASEPAPLQVPPLKTVAPFPIGCSVMTGHLADLSFTEILDQHVSQLTPEWEMKMEYIIQSDGTFRFDAPDAIAAYARQRGMRLFGHALIWYAQENAAFRALEGDRNGFINAYRNYIHAVVGRYRGQASGWDVVNEPVADDGLALRGSLWSYMLGELNHIIVAFDHAAEADPGAVLFLNDYNLERRPKKRERFVRLVDELLSRGCKIGGLGTQTHIDIDTPRGAITETVRELSRFGLPIHLSELDISTNMKTVDLRGTDERLRLQAALAEEAAEAFMALPARQRFAFTLWGLRDKDSWLRGPAGTGPSDRPAMFDDEGRPKPALSAISRAFRG